MTTTALGLDHQAVRVFHGLPKASPQENALQVFQFDNVATGDSLALSALERDGQAWFVAGDVCTALGIHNSRDALSRLDEDEKGVATTDTPGGRQQVATINESGMYSLIFSSRKESAKKFKKWVTSVVIPSIRRHGGYINGQEALNTAEQAQTLLAIQDEALRVRAKHVEDRDARADAFRLMRGGRSYGPGGRKGGGLK
jgi:prophage antirepressor-like protein